ncbi:hypothetical protein DKX38_030109 (mitochondrion) [Salix brachista]|uniref:Uncharacterized protein n=1 Tax=Salix brachista TaxID=2182728 RepID=A0A5N5J047_9ROSI|nr:hypothetical protein DKX38_030109 [Salix brachista]
MSPTHPLMKKWATSDQHPFSKMEVLKVLLGPPIAEELSSFYTDAVSFPAALVRSSPGEPDARESSSKVPTYIDHFAWTGRGIYELTAINYTHSMEMFAFGMKMDEQALTPGPDEGKDSFRSRCSRLPRLGSRSNRNLYLYALVGFRRDLIAYLSGANKRESFRMDFSSDAELIS